MSKKHCLEIFLGLHVEELEASMTLFNASEENPCPEGFTSPMPDPMNYGCSQTQHLLINSPTDFSNLSQVTSVVLFMPCEYERKALV